VCRRAERGILRAAVDPEKDAGVLGYMNRLSTYLYVLARACNAAAGVAEVPWKG
jgi:cob(I)alamin adenosyltransferase